MEERWAQMMATLSNVRVDNFLKAFWTMRHGHIRSVDLFSAFKKEYEKKLVGHVNRIFQHNRPVSTVHCSAVIHPESGVDRTRRGHRETDAIDPLRPRRLRGASISATGRVRCPGYSGSISFYLPCGTVTRSKPSRSALFAGIIVLAGWLLTLEAVPLKASYLILLRRIVVFGTIESLARTITPRQVRVESATDPAYGRRASHVRGSSGCPPH